LKLCCQKLLKTPEQYARISSTIQSCPTSKSSTTSPVKVLAIDRKMFFELLQNSERSRRKLEQGLEAVSIAG
jgi:hypothetical protein